MPLVKMPDGAVVDMPDQLTPELAARLKALNSGFLSDQIPGALPPATPPPEPSVLDRIKGAGEAAATVASSIPAGIVAPVVGALQKGDTETNAARFVQSNTYQPKTEAGRQATQWISGLLSNVPAMIPEIPNLPAGIGEGVPAQAENIASRGLAGVANAPGAAVRGVGSAARNVVGMTTGVGPEAFKEAFQAGRTGAKSFVANMRGEVPIEQVLTDAKNGVQNMQNAMSAEYKSAKTGWAADKTKLDFAPIDEAFGNLDQTLKVEGHSLIGKSEQAHIDELKGVLDEWRKDPNAHTTLGLDALKRRIDAIYPDSPKMNQAQRIIAGTRNAVKDTIVKQAPDYASAMQSYETQISLIRDIEKALSLGDKVSKDTAIRKLQSLMRNNAQTNYGYRLGLADALKSKGGVDIRPAVAGQSLNPVAPRGLSRLGALGEVGMALHNPMVAAALPLSSPRLMGEAFYGAGRLAGGLQKGGLE